MQLSTSDVVGEIWGLAERRKWDVIKNEHEWCLCVSKEDVILIGRLGIGKYKEAYISLHKAYKGKELGFNCDEDLKKVDRWILEHITKEIPSAKKFTFKFYSLESIMECNKEDSELVYTPDFLDSLKFN